MLWSSIWKRFEHAEHAEQVFYKNVIPKKLRNIHRETIVSVSSSFATFLKRDSRADIFLWLLRNFSKTPVLKSTCKPCTPCSVYTLNLCAVQAVESNEEAGNHLSKVLNLYMSIFSSPPRWKMLKETCVCRFTVYQIHDRVQKL